MTDKELEAKETELQKKRGVYLLPNLLTTGALFAGFYAVVTAMTGFYSVAAIAIFVAMVLDSLDGRVARLTNTTSEFGAQYDSISDMVAFGVAPALVSYSWSLSTLGKLGWLIAFLYSACTALRLARFNIQREVVDKSYFKGLPCPSAAGFVAGFVWVGHEYALLSKMIIPLSAVITIMAALLMVSNFRYYSFKTVDFRGKVPFVMLFGAVMVFVAISLDPPQMLFYFFLLYVLSGPVLTFWTLYKAKKQRRAT